MDTQLKEGETYCFFPNSYFTGGKVAGFTNAEVCAFCTKNYVFVLPKKDFTHYLVAMRQRNYNYFGEGIPIPDGIQQLVSEEGMTVEKAEQRLVEMLGENEHDRVIKVSDLTQFKTILLGPLSQVRMKHKAGGAVKVLSCKGKGNMKKFKEFYS